MSQPYDALLLISYGGPERSDDVIPFLRNVLRGRPIAAARMDEIAERYKLFDGVSPLNAQIRALLAAVVAELNDNGPQLPVYWGNRNWHPMLADTLQQMADDGIRRALAFATSAFGCYTGCRQYQEDIAQAGQAIGPEAPQVDKLRLFYNHPGFIEPMAERTRTALTEAATSENPRPKLLFTAHSIPVAMAANSSYVAQLTEACRLVAEEVDVRNWELAYQSRSGRPSEPWLEPDLGSRLVELRRDDDLRDVVIVPIGFLVDNMEIVYDLDIEIAGLCDELGINMVRAGAIGTHPRFVSMIRELIVERIEESPTRLALGTHGASHDVCPADCCKRGSGS
jgi:protoporphyrin/coproporphyrin ferrochelatase